MDENRYSPNVSTISLFVSSPGDVAHERRIARESIARLNTEFDGRIVLDAYFWEYEPFDFSKSFQEQIPNTATFDVVLCLLWSRLGSRLGASQRLPDGSPASSGTEYEITNALAGQKERKGLPELHVWINQTVPSFQPEPPELHDEKIAQWRALKRFIERWTKDSEDGSFVGSFTAYHTIGDFQDLFEIKLRKIAERRATLSPGTLAPPSKPEWAEGSPFRGLEPFDYKHAPIFFGRTAAISEAIEALRKTQADKDDPRGFLLVLGASGSGKSSLARAGILPVLTEPGVIDGAGLWRRALMKPSDAGGDLLLGLANAILAESALAELTAHGITPGSLAADPAAIPEEIRSGLRVISEREQARQRSQTDALINQRESENRPEDAVALRARLSDLRPPAARFVLLVDQLEELFTEVISPEKRQAFLETLAILSRRNPVVVIGTMRSDFFPRLAEFPRLLALAQGSASYHLPPPAPVELGQIIRRPAQAAGLKFDTHPETKQGLDEALRDAAAVDPQVLPLLEFALEELYKRQNARRDGLLRWEDYLVFGGIEGVIAAKADEALATAEAGAGLEQAVNSVLSALVNFRTDRGETAVPIRRRAVPEEVAPSPEADRVLSAMLAARLLVSDTDAAGHRTISVAHEALLTRWPRAMAWFETNQEFLKQRGRVEAAYAVWEKEGRDPAYLVQPGKPLDDAIWLLNQSDRKLATETAGFIVASKNRANQDARRRFQRRVIAVSAALLLILTAGVVGLIALQERQRAAERRAQADAYFQVHQAGVQLAGGEFRSALALLENAFAAHPDFTTRSAFLSALALPKMPKQLETSYTGFEEGVQELQFGPDDALAVAAGGSVRLLDTRSTDASGPSFTPDGEEAPRILSIARCQDGSWLAQREDGITITLKRGINPAQSVGSRNQLRRAALSPDGRRLAGVDARRQKQISIGAVDDFRNATPLEPFASAITTLAFGPDGRLTVATEAHGIFSLSDSGEKQQLSDSIPGKVRCLAWRNQGEPLLAAGDENGDISILRGEDGTLRKRANVPGGVQDLAWSPDGRSLAVACSDGTVRIWVISSDPDAVAQPPEILSAHKGPVLSVAWSSGGSRLASGGNDGTVCIWQPSKVFGPVVTYDKGAPLHSLAVSKDGLRIAAGSERGDIFTWNAGSNINSSVWHVDGRVLSLAWQLGQERIASGSESGDVHIWQWMARDPIWSVKPGEPGGGNDQTIWRVRWSLDGKKLASSSLTGAMQVWEPNSGTAPRFIGKLPDYALGLAWSLDDTTLAVGSTRGEIWLWNAAGGAEPSLKMPRDAIQGHGDGVASLAFLPGGKLLASCGRDGTLRLWDVRSGAALARTLQVGGALDDLALSEDGSKIVAAGSDGYLRIWESDGLTPNLAVPLHQRPVGAVAWNGSRIFSASEDGTVRVVDLDETKWASRARQVIGIAVGKPSKRNPNED
jgi:WD40 repeat protein